MKLFKIHWSDDNYGKDPELMAGCRAFIEDVYNRGGEAGLYLGIGGTLVALATFVAGFAITCEVCKKIDEIKERRNHEQEVIE